MKESLHIQQRLRTLLQRFYDGTSTPEEEREINMLLSSEECHSDEFDDDRRLFDAMNGIVADTAPPPALGDKLEEMAAAHFRNHRKHTPIWLRWGAAAAIFLGVALTLPLRKSDSPAHTPQAPLTAQAAPQAVALPDETQPAETTVVTPPASKPHRHTPRRHRTVVTTAPAAPTTDDTAYDNAGEYLTPEQAARISEAALLTVARTLASADGVYRHTDERIGSTISTTLGLLPAELNSPANNI